jgi:hypothetical protein
VRGSAFVATGRPEEVHSGGSWAAGHTAAAQTAQDPSFQCAEAFVVGDIGCLKVQKQNRACRRPHIVPVLAADRAGVPSGGYTPAVVRPCRSSRLAPRQGAHWVAMMDTVQEPASAAVGCIPLCCADCRPWRGALQACGHSNGQQLTVSHANQGGYLVES